MALLSINQADLVLVCNTFVTSELIILETTVIWDRPYCYHGDRKNATVGFALKFSG